MNDTRLRKWLSVGMGMIGLAGGTITLAAADFPNISSVYARYAADNPANITVDPLSQTFDSGSVDIANQKLALSNLGFATIVYPSGIGPATPVYFRTTGTLPAPLIADTPYYLQPAVSGGYLLYAVAVDADAWDQPGGVLGEKVLPAQNVSQAVKPVVLLDGGTGTHTLYTKTLLRQFSDLSANGYYASATSSTDKHTFLEIDTDANGLPFIHTGGATARENFVGNYNAYGQVFFQGPSTKRFEARQKVGGKRVVYQVMTGRVRSFKERQVMKFLDTPAEINIDSNLVTYAADARMSNKINTGDLINVKAYPGSTLPTPLQEGVDYYARKVGTKTVTLHPTATDATNNTNVIDLVSTGSGSFLFWDPERVGDSRRWSFFAEVLAPNNGGNTLSVRLQEPVPSAMSVLKIASSFVTSGSGNGNISGLVNLPDLTPVVIWAPPRALLPAPLQAGVRYWTTKTPGSSTYGRLHATLASAQESVGQTTANSSCIKYAATGKGELLFSYDDDCTGISFGTLTSNLVYFNKRVPLGPLCVLVFKIDFNDPDQTGYYATLGVNEAVTEQTVHAATKGLTPDAINDGSAGWSLFNSAQGHVPIDFDCYEMVFGSSTDAVPDSDIQSIVDYMKAKYHVGGSVPAVPAGVTASAANQQISLSWTPVEGATGYRIKVSSTSGGPYTERVVVSASSSQYTDSGLTNGVAYYYVVTAINDIGDSSNSAEVSAVPVSGLSMTAAVLRKTQGGAGTFDLPVSISSLDTGAVESRNGTDVVLVVSFNKNVTAGAAAIGSGTATVSGTPTFSGSAMTLLLSGVGNAQSVQVNLSNLRGEDGSILDAGVVRFRMLAGDANGDGVVASGDINLTKSKSGQSVSSSNFRLDFNDDGVISSADINFAKSRSGTSVP